MSTLFYLSMIFWPVNLLPIYTRWEIDPPKVWQLLPIPVIFGAAWWLWQNRATWGRNVIFGLGFFLLMVAPVLGPGRIVVARVEGEFLAVGHGANAVSRNPERHEIGSRRHRPPLAESQVVFVGAAFVAVTFDRNPGDAAFLNATIRVVKGGASVGADGIFIEIEIYRLAFAQGDDALAVFTFLASSAVSIA